jgi:hypothetical protein
MRTRSGVRERHRSTAFVPFSASPTTSSSSAPARTTRHHRVDERFLSILEEDFGIDLADLNAAFLVGIPAPKKQCIAVCEWAIRSAGGDPFEAGKALRAWARNHGRGAYDPRMLEAPPVGE